MDNKVEMQKTTVYLPPGDIVDLKIEAAKISESYATIVRFAVKDYLKKLKRRAVTKERGIKCKI